MRQIFILFGLLASLLRAQAQTCTATLCGTVTDAETRAPIAFAEIFIPEIGVGDVTDEAGKFHLHNLCEGTYTVESRHIGCEHLAKEVRIVGDVQVDFELSHAALPLNEIVIRETAAPLANVQAEQHLSGIELDAAKGQTLGDALRNLPGVATLNTGSTIVKPVIRGLHSSRVLVLNNGVRQEGQQWGLEHAPEIDPYLADRLTVVMGANSVRYGADALGGVVLVEPKPLRIKPGAGGEVNLAGFSNGRTGVASALLDGKFGDRLPLAARLQGTLKRGGNVRTPGYFLTNTGVAESNWSAALGWKKGGAQAEVFYSYFFTKTGIFSGSHVGNLTDLQLAIERGRPATDGEFSYELGKPLQRVAHHLLKTKASLPTGDAGKLVFQYARQFNRRQEFDAHKRFGSPSEGFDDPDMEFEITSNGVDLAWEHKPWKRLSGSVGGSYLRQVNTTDRGGLLPNFDSHLAGIFWLERWRKHPFPVELEAGLRYDFRRLNVGNRGNEIIGKTLNFNNLSGTFGGVWRLPKHLEISLHLGSAWRSPGVNELYSDGVHHGSASYEKGRDDLVPERAFSANLSLNFDFLPTGNGEQKLRGTLSVYRNQIQDFIYLQPQAQPVLTIRGAFPAFRYKQADARLHGLDWNAEWKPLPVLVFSSGASLLRAWNRSAGEPLIFMPADRFRHKIKVFFKRPAAAGDEEELPFASLGMVNVLRQNRVPENQDYAPPPPGYVLFELEGGKTFRLKNQRLDLGLSIQNLFNTAYRDYLNRLRYFGDEAGRNVSARLKFTF